jgi:DNA-directed RNA polymerase specialized sigma24 family protein
MADKHDGLSPERIEALLGSVRRQRKWKDEEVVALAHEAHLLGEQLFAYCAAPEAEPLRHLVENHVAVCAFCHDQLDAVWRLTNAGHHRPSSLEGEKCVNDPPEGHVMNKQGEVTRWLAELKQKEPEAARHLWERYYRRLVGLARARLRGLPRRAADEEDVALSAFDSFCRGAEQGRFPRLEDRDDLWQVLVMITARKAADLRQKEGRQKRGGGKVRGESALLVPGAEEGGGMAQVVGGEPTPEFACAAGEECRRLLEQLPDEALRALALGKLEGYSNAELAKRLGWSLAKVERKLARIRHIWKQLRRQE